MNKGFDETINNFSGTEERLVSVNALSRLVPQAIEPKKSVSGNGTFVVYRIDVRSPVIAIK